MLSAGLLGLLVLLLQSEPGGALVFRPLGKPQGWRPMLELTQGVPGVTQDPLAPPPRSSRTPFQTWGSPVENAPEGLN
jgi:hypothetical protein